MYVLVTSVTLFHPESYSPSGVNLSLVKTLSRICATATCNTALKNTYYPWCLHRGRSQSNTDGRNRTRNFDISGSRKACKFLSAWRNAKARRSIAGLKDPPERRSTRCSSGHRWPALFNGRLHCVACSKRQVKSDAKADPPPVSMAPLTLPG